MNKSRLDSEKKIAYYPYGGVIADLGFGHDRQQRKFGGKELMTANGLNEYDFLARLYYPIVPMFTTIDPMCEKYYWLSPYLYCGNDPVNAIDPIGKDVWNLNSKGEIISHKKVEDYDQINILDSKNELISKSWKGEYGTIKNLDRGSKSLGEEYDSYRIIGDDDAKGIFEFLASNTSVEWTWFMSNNNGNDGINYLTTSHLSDSEVGMTAFVKNSLGSKTDARGFIHNHPSNLPYPSGIDGGKYTDLHFAAMMDNIFGKSLTYKIFLASSKTYIEYSSGDDASHFDFKTKAIDLDEFVITAPKLKKNK